MTAQYRARYPQGARPEIAATRGVSRTSDRHRSCAPRSTKPGPLSPDIPDHGIFLCRKAQRVPHQARCQTYFGTVQIGKGRLREISKSRPSGRSVAHAGTTAEPAIQITNRDKVFFPPPESYTKGDLIDYYTRMAPHILPAMKDRPLVLKRFPNGIDGKSFYQQSAPDDVPDGVRVETIKVDD